MPGAEVASAGPPNRITYFVIKNESDDDSRVWAGRFRDERLGSFGYLGYGWVLWLENGQLRDVEPYTGHPDHSPREVVERTRACGPDAEQIAAATDGRGSGKWSSYEY